MSNNGMFENESEVKVKISSCQKCGGLVRVAVLHEMNTKSKNEFAKEVIEHDLAVKTQLLTDFRNENPKWCNCSV